MTVMSLEFVAPLLLAGMLFFYLPGTRFRQFALAGCNAAFLYCCLSGWSSWLVLAAFVLSGYGVAVILKRKSGAMLLAVYLVLLVAAFVVVKKYVILRPFIPAEIWNFSVGTLGLSYLLFRQIHFLVGVFQQDMPRWSLWSYLNYQLNLFGFLSGPIQRYPEFQDHWSRLEPILTCQHEVLVALLRLSLGVIKVRLSEFILPYYTGELNWFAFPMHGYFGDPLMTHSPGRLHTLRQFAIVFYGYPLYLYLNFSGYCDIVIAAAALVGLRMPENFDRPYLSRNINDYWVRFHRTLGFWIRDYLFIPSYKPLVRRWSKYAMVLVFPCYFMAFLLAGAWHGTTNNFAVFGALHGIGISAGKGWENIIVKISGRKGLRAYLASTPVRVAAITTTITYVSFTMLFFPNSTHVALSAMHEFARRMIR